MNVYECTNIDNIFITSIFDFTVILGNRMILIILVFIQKLIVQNKL